MLICFSAKHSHAVYLDSESAKKKDYTFVMRFLDDALAGYREAGGKIVKHKFSKHQSGVSVFNHVTQFTCVKQPAGSVRDAYYALYQMRRLYRTNATLRCQVISNRGPKRGRQSPMQILSMSYFTSNGRWRLSSFVKSK